MTDDGIDRSKGIVMGPEEGASFWQPVPANGYVINKLVPANWDGPFSMGFQIVAPHSYIRRHVHDRNREVIVVLEGRGTAVLSGAEQTIEPGSVVALPTDVEHMFKNDGDVPLKLLWVFAPHGLETFFEAIGRPRAAGEPEPEPFSPAPRRHRHRREHRLQAWLHPMRGSLRTR